MEWPGNTCLQYTFFLCSYVLPFASLSLLMSSILSPLLFSLAVCLACDGPEAAMLSSQLNLLFPFSKALTLLYSAHTLSLSPSSHIIPVFILSLLLVSLTLILRPAKRNVGQKARHRHIHINASLPFSFPPSFLSLSFALLYSGLLSRCPSCFVLNLLSRKKRGQEVTATWIFWWFLV